MDAALKAIAEPRRRAILALVRDRELPAGEIARHFEVTRPAVSQHLRVLRQAGLVAERRDGTRRLYRARPEKVDELVQFLDAFWAGGLDRLRAAAEDAEREKRERGSHPMAELVREVLVDASPDTIFEMLTVPEQHLRWEGTEAELDPRPGGLYRVVVAGKYHSSGEYVEVVPGEKVVFTFGWEDDGNPVPPGSSTIEITLHPEGGKTRVRLVHRDIPDEVVEPHVMGWDHYLARMAVAAAGGDAGPDLGPSA